MADKLQAPQAAANGFRSMPKAMDIPGRGQVDLADVSQSYGGTIYGTTPGGTRIVYTRDMLLNCRHSPLSKALPEKLPEIPGVTRGIPFTPKDNADEDEDDFDPAAGLEGNAEGEEEKDSEEVFELDDK
eukprot:GGOE01018289.1.p2 GENE.GGOE01018289.1~~GGOE01018289.1.p2  ORF type:complete len:148 (+),score=35.38 GGOE01018289.1:58-444(+)